MIPYYLIIIYYLTYLIQIAIFSSIFVALLHSLVPQLLPDIKFYSYYFPKFFDLWLEQKITYICCIMHAKNYTPMLLKLHKNFLFIWIIGNFASYIGFLAPYNSDWHLLFIWNFAICVILYIYWISIFYNLLLNKWVNDFGFSFSLGSLLIFLIELSSILMRILSLTTRLAMNTFAGSIYVFILHILIFHTAYETPSIIFNLCGYLITFYLIIIIYSELVKIIAQCLLLYALTFYYISESLL